MKILGLILPGFWHIFQDRTWKGLALFIGYAFCLNAFLIWPLAFSGATAIRFLFLTAAVAVWLFSTVEMYKKPRRAAPRGEPLKPAKPGV